MEGRTDGRARGSPHPPATRGGAQRAAHRPHPEAALRSPPRPRVPPRPRTDTSRPSAAAHPQQKGLPMEAAAASAPCGIRTCPGGAHTTDHRGCCRADCSHLTSAPLGCSGTHMHQLLQEQIPDLVEILPKRNARLCANSCASAIENRGRNGLW